MNISRVLGKSCKASYDLAVAITGYHFNYILLVKQVSRANPNSKGREVDSTFQRRSKEFTLIYHSLPSEHKLFIFLS